MMGLTLTLANIMIMFYLFTVDTVNECMYNNGGCSQFCMNTFESYYCSCYNGFSIVNEAAVCEGEAYAKCSISFKTPGPLLWILSIKLSSCELGQLIFIQLIN